MTPSAGTWRSILTAIRGARDGRPVTEAVRRLRDDRCVLPHGYRDLFESTATVSGTLIGLLFVAVSVLPERVRTGGAHGPSGPRRR